MPTIARTPRSSLPARHALATAVLIALGASPLTAAAQSSAPAADDNTVVVTGTRAKDRTVISSTAPIDVLSADDLKRAAGADGTLASALQALLPSFNFPRQSNSSGADHVRAAQLRGLSPDQVLVLVNGKRRHTAAVVNLDSKIGKGTNPVDFNSIPLNAIQRIEVLRDGAGAQYGSDAIAGVINVILDTAAQGGEIEAVVGQYRTSFEPTGQRINDGRSTELRAKGGLGLGNGGFLRAGAEVTTRDATNRAGFDKIPFFEDQTPANLALAGRVNYNAGEPAVDGLNLWANSALPLGGDLTAYGVALYNRRESVGSAFFRYPDSFANVPAVYPDGYRPETTGTNLDLSLSGGLRGSLSGGWSFDTGLTFGRNQFDYGLQRSLNASLGAASPTSFDLGNFRFSQLTANADFTRDLPVAGLPGPLLLAVGAEARREGFVTGAGDAASYALGPFPGATGAQAGPGLQPGDTVDLSRTVLGIYADLGGDLTKTLFANAALRHDHYSDFGNATTAKLSARWAFAPVAALRAAVSNNFRAPSLAQGGFSFTVTDFGNQGQLTQVRLLPTTHPTALALGSRPLQAEKSLNFSAGLTLQPAKRTTLTIDAYRIDIDDRITLSKRFSVGDDAFNFFTNAIDTRTSGVDIVASHALPWGASEWQFSLASSFTRTGIRRVDAAAGVGAEEINTLTEAAPRNRHMFTTQWRQGGWQALARVTRHGETTRVFDFGGGFRPTQTYAARLQLDLEGEYAFNRQLSLAVGGVNVGDNYPSRSIADITYFGNFPYDVLSPIGFNGAQYYARLRYSF